MKERKHIVQPGNRISLYIHKHSFIYLFKNIFVLCMHAIYVWGVCVYNKNSINSNRWFIGNPHSIFQKDLTEFYFNKTQ